ncbi:mannosyltransferase [Flavobacteriaceae bacterium PRS1]|nr:mannosyltransferase [Flavobacteriaceae bacterium PRS1]
MALNTAFFKLYKIPLLLVVSSVLFYFSFGYDLLRTDYTKLIILYVVLFFLFYKLVQISKHNLKFLALIAFGFRAIFILAIPNLSQDFYRFIWDGRMILEGINPYLFTPESFISVGEFPFEQAKELYEGMGSLSAGHYSNYPPVNQLCFVIAGLFAGKSILGSVLVMRLIIITADFGTLCFGKRLLEKLNIPVHNIFWYILNPFIIIELTGNLHFEALMIFFLVWSLYLLHSGKWKFAALIFALSVSVKLIPLLFLPLFYQWFVRKKSVGNEIATSQVSLKALWIPASAGMTKLVGFYCIIGITSLLLFLPFYSSEFITNYTQTVALWFNNFEFNASIYYVAREIGYLYRGWNEIAIIGKIIPIIAVLFVLVVTFFRKNNTIAEIITAMLLVLSFYYFTTTTVHPWYIATLLILSVFTKYMFPLVWSFVIILSYLAYANRDNAENLWITGLEYLVVYSVFIWEVFFKRPKSSLELQHL